MAITVKHVARAGVANLFLLACFSGGCESAEPEPGTFTPFPWCTPADFERPDVELIEVDVMPTPGQSADPRFEERLDGALAEHPTACDCTDASCMIGWIEDNMGCGVCVHLSCASGPRSGCLACPLPTPSAERLDSNLDNDSTACVVAEIATNPPGWDIQVATSRDVH